MGAYRLLLAVAVVISHLGHSVFGLNIGVVAVVSFLIISGYVTTALVEKHYSDVSRIPSFLLDRCMRLFPQYWVYLLSSVALFSYGVDVNAKAQHVSALNVLCNVLMLPTNFYMFSPTLWPINPPTWTLGLEFSFYLLAPLLIVYRGRKWAHLLSVCFFMVAYAGVINRDWFGYRLIPGTLFIFLCGSFMRPSASMIERSLVYFTWMLSAVLFAMFWKVHSLHGPYNGEVSLGILIGIPAIAALSRLPYRKIDEVLGNISYGVYLNHFTFIWLFASFGINLLGRHMWHARLCMLVCSFALSWVTFKAIERPVIRLRHRLRRKAPDPSSLVPDVA